MQTPFLILYWICNPYFTITLQVASPSTVTNTMPDVAGIEKYSELALRTPIVCPKILDNVIILPEAFVTIT